MSLLQLEKWAVLGVYWKALWLARAVTCVTWQLAHSFPFCSSFTLIPFFHELTILKALQK